MYIIDQISTSLIVSEIIIPTDIQQLLHVLVYNSIFLNYKSILVKTFHKWHIQVIYISFSHIFFKNKSLYCNGVDSLYV